MVTYCCYRVLHQRATLWILWVEPISIRALDALVDDVGRGAVRGLTDSPFAMSFALSSG